MNKMEIMLRKFPEEVVKSGYITTLAQHSPFCFQIQYYAELHKRTPQENFTLLMDNFAIAKDWADNILTENRGERGEPSNKVTIRNIFTNNGGQGEPCGR